MRPVIVRNCKIGEGIPKICVPIVGVTREDILGQAEAFEARPEDIVEWRADWFEKVEDLDQVKDILKQLRVLLKDTPLLFTFRTAREGGERSIDKEYYARLNKEAAKTGYVDLVDVEIFSGDALVKNIIEGVHACGVKAIASNHDFDKTPKKKELVSRLCKMKEMGADISKIAVMPENKKDVLTLLSATEKMTRLYPEHPIITMSMSGTGVLSRMCGEVFGSAVTFASAGKASAPGQVAVHELRQMLHILHQNMQA